jgi:glyoxylase-like metal-dependent hydrolase (beta-lactamase superfamily II)
MALTRVDIISIGTLSRNRLWNETDAARTPHATTTLIRTGKRTILVDPGLPPQALAARLFERTGLAPKDVDTVFLTNFRPSHRGGLAAFGQAKVLINEVEQMHARAQTERFLNEAPEEDLDRKVLEEDLAILEKLTPAEDKLANGIDLFPLFGYTPGTTGLLVALPTVTILLAGDAVPTQDHFLAAQVLPDAHDIKGAQESLREVYEIADLIIPGHDNLFLNPRSQGI